jgi:teichuronic acid biosynthesis glycosyltransferase TuaC
LVSGARGSDLRARDRLSLMLTQRVLAQSAQVLTVSDDLRRIASERFGVNPQSATTIANGCNTRIFNLGDRAAARRALQLPEEGRLLVYVGRLVVLKGLRELLNAWAALAQTDPHLRIAFVGEGGLGEELAHSAKGTGMGDRVLMPGAASPAQVATWMRACNVFCLPSHTEGYPNVLVEALACGRPIVATPVGGIVEIVDDTNGVFHPVGDVAAIAHALQTALQRNWDEAALSRRFARSWDDVARETLSVCERTLPAPGLSGRAASSDRSTSRTTS